MFGLDHEITALSQGASPWIVAAVAIALGLRHAMDVDHLAAVATLVATERGTSAGSARRLGLAWGGGHAVSLTALGIPLFFLEAYLPRSFEQAVEVAVGVMIVGLSLRLLLRWRSGSRGAEEHAGERCTPHPGLACRLGDYMRGESDREAETRTPVGAFAIGLMHGMAGSAGVGVFLLASIRSPGLAVSALLLFALFTAVAMGALSSAVGLALALQPRSREMRYIMLILGLLTLAFGVWYGLDALLL